MRLRSGVLNASVKLRGQALACGFHVSATCSNSRKAGPSTSARDSTGIGQASIARRCATCLASCAPERADEAG